MGIVDILGEQTEGDAIAQGDHRETRETCAQVVVDLTRKETSTQVDHWGETEGKTREVEGG